MEKGFYIFRIKYYNEFIDKEKTVYGVTYATTYAEAVNNIVKDYEETSINDMKLYALSASDTLSLNKNICKNIKRGVYDDD